MLFLGIALAGGGALFFLWLCLRDPLMRRGIIRRPRRKHRGDYH